MGLKESNRFIGFDMLKIEVEEKKRVRKSVSQKTNRQNILR